MRPVQPVYTAHLFAPLHDKLLELLRGLSAEDWNHETVCKGWTVHDIAAHILDTQVRLITLGDNLATTLLLSGTPGYQDLVGFLNKANAVWVEASRRIGPRLLVEFLSITGPLLAERVASLPPTDPAPFSVAWAGENISPNWFDIGRSYTEYWHHQQQIRDAVGATPIDAREWLYPVLALFVRALPRAYQGVTANEGEAVNLTITGEAGGDWSILHKQNSWHLFEGSAAHPAASVSISADTAWRLFTKGLSREQAECQASMEGRAELGQAFFRTLAVMA